MRRLKVLFRRDHIGFGLLDLASQVKANVRLLLQVPDPEGSFCTSGADQYIVAYVSSQFQRKC